jgi:hypothetical protein
METTASIGVLSSWLIVESSSDFALSAVSAALRASRSATRPSMRRRICADRSRARNS